MSPNINEKDELNCDKLADALSHLMSKFAHAMTLWQSVTKIVRTLCHRSTNNMQVRELIAKDWPSIKRIYMEGIATGVASFRQAEPTLEEWEQTYLPPCRLALIEGDQIIGWAGLLAYSHMDAYKGVAETSIYIETDSRGKGAGEFLLGELSKQAESAGFWSLQSKVIKKNQASIHLHEKCGYRLIGYCEKIARDHDGVWQDIVLLEKRLDT